MATTVKELKATARPTGGKGAARAERRAGRVPGVIYGNNQPPVTISVDDKDLRQRILAGRFLTTIYDIDLEGKKHRVIPRDFHLDPVRDFPLHVDFMRLGEGATIRINVPLHVVNSEAAPGIKRGGTVNIVTHAIELECSVDNIPPYIEADASSLEIGHSLHLTDIKLPAGVKSLTRSDATLVTIVPPSGYAEEQKAAAAAAAAAGTTAAATPAAAGAAPAAGAAAAAPTAGAAPAPGAKAPPSVSAFPCTSRTRKQPPASSAAAPSTSSPTPSSWNARSITFRNISKPTSAAWKSATRCICPISNCRRA